MRVFRRAVSVASSLFKYACACQPASSGDTTVYCSWYLNPAGLVLPINGCIPTSCRAGPSDKWSPIYKTSSDSVRVVSHVLHSTYMRALYRYNK